jgi:ABC-type sugar transport system substrate-binding protein
VKRFGKKGLILVLGVGVVALAISAAAIAGTAKKSASVQVCVLLPDTKSSVRWVQFDAPLLKAAFAKAGVTASINNALNDPLKQKAQAQACLAAGAKVVIETSLDNGSASSIEKLFTDKGGKAIDYDRQVIGGTASVYDTFDGKAVGAAQANGIIAAMKAKGTYKKSSTVAELWGGQTDQNAFWFKSGNDAVLNPLFKKHALKKGPQKFVPDWDANNAATIFNQMLQDEQQHPGHHRGERQHRRRGGRRPEGQAPQADPAVRSGHDGAGCPVHPRRLAVGHGLQEGVARGERRGSCRDRTPQGEDARHERLPVERQEEGADAHAPGHVDHEEELQAALRAEVAEEERSLHRSVQEVLQVIRSL